MKSTTSLAVLTGLYTQATALVLTGPGVEVDRRNPSSGVLTDIPHPHSQIRLFHNHPEAAISSNEKRAASQTPNTVQGGAVLSLTPSGRTNKIKTVSASFTVPRAEIPAQGPTANNPVGVYAASFWVGIDGVSATLPSSPSSYGSSQSGSGDGNGSAEECNPSRSSLRLGVDIFYDGTLGGEQTPFAWYQALPGLAVGFGNFSVAPGDFVRLTASVSPASSSPDGATGGGGTVTVENFGSSSSNSTGNNKKKAALQTATHTFPPSDLNNLCQTQAGFIVEDFPLSGLPDFPIALTNFTKVEFGDLKVESTLGRALGLTRKTEKASVQTLDIYQAPQGGKLTDCAITGRGDSGKVVCARVVEP